MVCPPLAKIFLFFIVWLGVWLPLLVPLAHRLDWRFLEPPTPQQKLPLLGSLYLVVLPVIWGAARWEGATWTAYGWSWGGKFWGSVGLGSCVAIASLLVLVSLLLISGQGQWQNPEPGSALRSLFPVFLIGLAIGGIEEFIFRGMIWHWLQIDLGVTVAIVVSSLIFALSHLVWERENTWEQLPGLCLLGIGLALTRGWEGDHLGLAWGLHSGWIWGFAWLDTLQALRYSPSATSWWVGQSGQPLTGLAGLSCLGITFLGLWWGWG